MDFIINEAELSALYGLPSAQQLVYLRGIRPYMDVKTGITGSKRGISLQSIAEQIYIEPHQGIKAETYSRAQVRRALVALERVGRISNYSENLKLILKCELASRIYSDQNKGVTKQSQQPSVRLLLENNQDTSSYDCIPQKPSIEQATKADTPLYKDNYISYISHLI